MKKLLVLYIIFAAFYSYSQKNDYIWFNGSFSWYGCDSLGWCYGIDKLDFNYSPMLLEGDSLSIGFEATNGSICDDSGNLKLFSNGRFLMNGNKQLIENGDSLNFGYFYHSGILDSTYSAQQALMIIPSIDSTGQYYVIHTFVDTSLLELSYYYGSELRYSLVDMNANGGAGKVLKKNMVLFDSVHISTPIMATKQGNGRDWWIIIKSFHESCFRVFSLTPNGLKYENTQCIGDEDFNASIFTQGMCMSPDGSNLITTNYDGEISVYDFDRCSASISDFRKIILKDSIFGVPLYSYVSVSSNSRYMYAMNVGYIYQYDLLATDISASKQLVATCDPMDTSLHGFSTDFRLGQLGPDGKIYISGNHYGTISALSLIHEPDSAGTSCFVEQNAITLPNVSNGFFPNIPNYRLGRLIGSPCDTLYDAINDQPTSKNDQLKLFPNPTSTELIIDYGFLNWSGLQNVTLTITNTLGQTVFEMPIPDYSAIQRLNVAKFASGIYNVSISSAGVTKMSGSFVKE